MGSFVATCIKKMSMECKIGTVKEIMRDKVIVLIERQSACSQCHAKGACTSADKDNQLIEVQEIPIGLTVGTRVRIVAVEGGTPLKAVLFAFVIPIVLIGTGAIVMNQLETKETTMLLILLCGLLLYCGLLWLLRGYFEKTFRLRAELVD